MLRKASAPLVLLATVATVGAAGPVTDGKWMLTTVNAAGENVLCILKVDGANVSVAFSPANVESAVSDFKATDKDVTFTLKQTRSIQGRNATSEFKFAGYPGTTTKQVLGTLNGAQRSKLASTDKETLAQNEMLIRGPVVEPFQKAQQLASKPALLQSQAVREQDADKKRELMKQAADARKEADEQVAALYREVVTKHADSAPAFDAAMALLRAPLAKLTADDAAVIVKLIEKHAAPYGSQFLQTNMLQVAEMLGTKGHDAVALTIVEPLAKALTDADKPSQQVRVLTTYKSALDKTGRTADATTIGARLAKVEGLLDQEYLATVPPFKPAAFAGRQAKDANRVAVMELFTGAQCPPCVAADVAFDALGKAYKHTDLVLIQYHMHIPGPDPMTNPDCIARWDYYREKFPEGIRGTPSTLFNGKADAGGGGGMANAETKFKQYKGIIDPLLEANTPLTLTGKGGRVGDKIDVTISVNGATPVGDDLKLRVMLVEESVRYVGGNNLRFHHHVVRAMPGGAAGVTVKENGFKHVVTADLAEIKTGLNKYLDDYTVQRPGAFKARPVDLKNLKVIAFVQNDKTREILQATIFDLEAGKDTASR